MEDDIDVIEQNIGAQLGFSVTNFTRVGAENAIGLLSGFDFPIGDLQDGFFLTTGELPGGVNTSPSSSIINGQPGDADLQQVANSAFSGAGQTEDAATISFTINIEDIDVDGISFDLIFGSEEFPEFSNTDFVDVAAVFVNGVNVGLFNNNPETPLSIIDDNIAQGNFIDNTGGDFATELDGFSQVLTIRTALQQGQNDIKIGIADTGDSIFDSALFVSNLNLLTGGATVSGVLTVVDDEEGDSAVNANSFDEEINLVDGQDTVQGSLSQLDGDVITGFGTDDTLTFEDTTFDEDNFTITLGSAIIEVDTDLDGIIESTVVLEGDFADGQFVAASTGGNTDLTFVAAAPPDGATSGPDFLLGTSQADTIFASGGDDTIRGFAGSDNLKGEAGSDNIKGGGGADTVKGNGGDDRLNGGGGQDRVVGGGGDDVVLGRGGNDLLFGRGGDDTLVGNAGDDTLMGNSGNDVLKGQGGADVFSFKRNDGSDVIRDFKDGTDMIEIRNGADSVDDLLITRSSSDVLITFKGTVIRLRDEDVDDITADDFLF